MWTFMHKHAYKKSMFKCSLVLGYSLQVFCTEKAALAEEQQDHNMT